MISLLITIVGKYIHMCIREIVLLNGAMPLEVSIMTLDYLCMPCYNVI